jgi:hypothetical protein
MSLDPALIAQEYQSMDDIINGLTALEQAFRESEDRRGVFVTAYVLITQETKRRIEGQQFEDGAWVTRFAVSFANRYRVALVHYENNELNLVSKSWIASFDTSSQGSGLVIQDLILGINAHVNHDLPVALNDVSIDPDRELRHRDYTAVNDALTTAITPVRAQIEKLYAPGLGLFDPLLDPLENELTSFSFEKAREHAWAEGVALANAQNEQERDDRLESIDEQSGVLAQLILAPTAENPLLLTLLRQVEQANPWWQFVSVPVFG